MAEASMSEQACPTRSAIVTKADNKYEDQIVCCINL